MSRRDILAARIAVHETDLTEAEIQSATLIQGTTDILLKDGRVFRPAGHGKWTEVDELDELDEQEEREEKAANPAGDLKTTPVKELKDYRTYTLADAQAKLTKLGFEQVPDREANHRDATVYTWKNPVTGQRANLSHHFVDKRGRKIDEAKLGFYRMVQPKRRTPEQKRRDNFVLYD